MTINAPAAAAIAVPRMRGWTVPLFSVFSLSVLWAWLYRGEIASAVTTWWVSPTYSHCFLILPIAGWLVWQERQELARLVPRSQPLFLLLALPVGLASVTGTLAAINEVQQLAAIAMLQVIILACLGSRVYRVIRFPALLLFFLVPVGQYLVPLLQHLTTLFVSASLSALNILHYTEGNVIELANGKFLVAEACAGLRFLIANIVLCLIFAHFAFRRPLKIALFMLAAVVVPIAANCLRALGIVLIAHATNNRLAAGTDHLVYGWAFSVLILALLFAGAIRLRDPVVRQNPSVIPREGSAPSPARNAAVVIMAAIMLVLPSLLLRAQSAAFPALHPTIQLSPPGGWSKAAAETWSPSFPGAAEQFHQALQQPGRAPVQFAYGYYAADDHPPADMEDKLWQEEQFNAVERRDLAQGPTRLREVVLAGPSGRRLLWWTYWKDNSFTPSALQVKRLAVRNAFGAHSGIAVVVLSTRLNGVEDEARDRLRAALWTLKAFSPRRGP